MVEKQNKKTEKLQKKLTLKQQLFVEAYAGNATEAALQAGYSKKTADKQGYNLLTNDSIQKAIEKRTKKHFDQIIAERKERQAFWTNIMRDKSFTLRDRLRSSELLGKSEGDFFDRFDGVHEKTSTQPIQVNISHLSLDEVMNLVKIVFPKNEES